VNAPCTPPGSPCKTGTTSCSTGTPVCNATGNVPDGPNANCGAGQVCYQGACKTPNCSGVACGGSDGAGGTCTNASGTCTSGLHCVGSSCTCDTSSCSTLCCGNACCSAAGANQRMTCSASNQCAAACDHNVSLSCSGGSHPCGSWGFETGTDGWTIDPIEFHGSDGRPLASTTARSFVGTRSLLVGYGPGDYLDISITPCPGQTFDLATLQNITGMMYAEPKDGTQPASDVNVTVHWYFGTDSQSYVEASQINHLPFSQWSTFTGSKNASFQTILRVNIEIFIAAWSGTLYFDDVHLN
jgi:hypothetical protein